MISYGNVPLLQPSAELLTWLETQIPPQEVFSFYQPKQIGSIDPLPYTSWFLERGVRLNTFFNPWGASRWGMAYVMADDAMLDRIKRQVFAFSAANNYKSLPFKMDDGIRSMTTNLWMLPAIPLNKVVGAKPRYAGWLLVLVDERYFWWEKTASLSITEGVTTWNQLFDAIAIALGIVLTVDSIPAVYMKPVKDIAAFEHLPLILDMAANAVGQRVVRTLDGSFYSRSAVSALALQTLQAKKYRKYAGGSLDLGAIDV